MLDEIDRHILQILQDDASVSVAEVADAVGLSTTPCWRRIQRLEQQDVIRKRVALLNREPLHVSVTVFVAVRTQQHTKSWLEDFHKAVDSLDEVVEAYRLSGDIDYMLRIVVPDIAAYDRVYKQLISMVEFADVSSSFAMEEMKYTTALPMKYV